MTEDELKAIEERVNATTPGKWIARNRDILSDQNGKYVRPVHLLSAENSCSDDDYSEFTEADCEFIAHAREDIPALIAELRRLRESGPSA